MFVCDVLLSCDCEFVCFQPLFSLFNRYYVFCFINNRLVSCRAISLAGWVSVCACDSAETFDMLNMCETYNYFHRNRFISKKVRAWIRKIQKHFKIERSHTNKSSRWSHCYLNADTVALVRNKRRLFQINQVINTSLQCFSRCKSENVYRREKNTHKLNFVRSRAHWLVELNIVHKQEPKYEREKKAPAGEIMQLTTNKYAQSGRFMLFSVFMHIHSTHEQQYSSKFIDSLVRYHH